MFFKKLMVKRPLGKWGPVGEIPWDDKTLNWIAESQRLEVRVTHICKTLTLGQIRGDSKYLNETGWMVWGVMTRPKLILVNITFSAGAEEFGGFSYNSIKQEISGREIDLPCLNLWLSDENEEKAQLLYSALRDAIVCGQMHLAIGFWKNIVFRHAKRTPFWG